MNKPPKSRFPIKIIVAFIIFLAIFLTKFPVLYHALNTPSGFWFVKQASWFDAWDMNAYVSYIRYGQRFGMMLVNTYTTIPHSGVFVFQYYTLLGVINRFLHLDPFVLFHLSSIVTDVLLVLVLYFISVLFITKLRDRLIVFTLIVLGGGLSWLPGLQNISAELVTPDFNFLKPFNIGHDAFSILLSFLSLGLFFVYFRNQTRLKDTSGVAAKNDPGSLLRELDPGSKDNSPDGGRIKKDSKYLLFAALAGFNASIFHPYKILWFVVVGILVAIWKWKYEIRHTGSVVKRLSRCGGIQYSFLLILFFILYFSFALSPFLKSPGFAGISNEAFPNINIFSLILGFGILSPFIAWEIFFGDEKKDEVVFVKLCFLSQFFLLFIPLPYARQFIPGLYVWGAILAYFGMRELIKIKKLFGISLESISKPNVIARSEATWQSLAHASSHSREIPRLHFVSLGMTVITLFSLISSFNVFLSLMKIKPNNPWFFLTKDEGETITSLSKLPKDSGILALYRIGNYIPAFSDNKVYFGHFYQTPNSQDAFNKARLFYARMNEKEQREFIKQNRIDYIYYGLEESALRKQLKLSTDNPFPYFPVAYKNESVIIYIVRKT